MEVGTAWSQGKPHCDVQTPPPPQKKKLPPSQKNLFFKKIKL